MGDDIRPAKQFEKFYKAHGEEQERLAKAESSVSEKKALFSQIKFLSVPLIFGLLALGYWALAPSSTDVSQIVSPSPIPSPATDLKAFANSSSMEFVQIPAGEFDMGSPSGEKNRENDEGPVHHVKITNAFYMGKYEVTQKQWRDVMGSNPSNFKGDNLPVETVSWNDVQDFIQKLNQKENTDKYRLPTEAEWEYSVRAGTTTSFSFGDDERMLGDYAWYTSNSGGKTHDVGQKKPNSWGLYDMQGNVWEWVQDIYHDSYEGAPTDGSAWERDGFNRVFRGGSWYNDWFDNFFWTSEHYRSAYRWPRGKPSDRGPDLGFRLVMDLPTSNVTTAVVEQESVHNTIQEAIGSVPITTLPPYIPYVTPPYIPNPPKVPT